MNHRESAPDRDGVEAVHYSTAGKLLDALSPRNGNLWNGQASKWIFRGQADAEWQLQPRAVRDESALEIYGLFRRSGQTNEKIGWAERRDMVEDLLTRFRSGLDQSGISIPAPSPKILCEEHMESMCTAHPSPETFPLMALAQHHGLPTMFLDWSRRPRVAAYFAAIQAWDLEPPADRLAIWALERGMYSNQNANLRFYEAPAGSNPNLHAQSALFTLHVDENEACLEECLVRFRHELGEPFKLRQLTLDACEAPKLLQLLFDEGVHGGSLFPGPDGAAKAMRERARWPSE